MYNLNDIKSVPCVQIARDHGVDLKESHGQYWCKLRSHEKTASCKIDDKKNLWYDFGMAKGGSGIDLVMELDGVSREDAIRRIAEDYGIEKEVTTGWRALTNNQYKELGIDARKATFNFGYDLNKHTPKQLELWNEKYGMTVQDLAEKYPSVYNKMVTKIALEGINEVRKVYGSSLKMLQDPNNNQITNMFLKTSLREYEKDINRCVDLLQKAITNKVDFSKYKVELDRDIKRQELNEVKKESKIPSEDEQIKNRVVNAYKKLFNYKAIEYFTNDQAKALSDINIIVSKLENRYLPIETIKNIHKTIGKNIENLSSELEKLRDRSEGRLMENRKFELESEIEKSRDIFSKCSKVIEGINEATIAIKNIEAKQKIAEGTIKKEPEISYER